MKKFIYALTVLLAGAVLAVAGDDAQKPAPQELTGQLGCGHCAYHKTTSCAATVKTADGKFYVIDNATKDIMAARTKGGEIKVAGTVTEKDGLYHVQATKQELVK